MPLHVQEPDQGSDEFLAIRPQFARPGEFQDVPRYRLPDGGMDADTAYQVVHDELMLDGRARLNLATFVTTWMEPQARSLVAETLDKNMIDKDEYPQTAELEHRCVSILAALWHAEPAGSAVGTSTIGSSEAAMLGGLALKWRWRRRMGAAERPTDRPNLVMGSNVQVCWEKFCRYWDVQPRLVPMRDGRYPCSRDRCRRDDAPPSPCGRVPREQPARAARGVATDGVRRARPPLPAAQRAPLAGDRSPARPPPGLA